MDKKFENAISELGKAFTEIKNEYVKKGYELLEKNPNLAKK